MNASLSSEVRRLGGDPADEVWRWFLLRGPHGPSFSWSQRRSEPPGYVGVEHLRAIVAERAAQDPEFLRRVGIVARQALTSEDRDIVRRGLQVSGALPLLDVATTVQGLTEHPDASVASDARACLFLLKSARR
jgi:hypothetical protein